MAFDRSSTSMLTSNSIACSAIAASVRVFDVQLQPRQRVVPLPGYLIEIIPNLLDRMRFELKQALAPDAHAAHNSHIRQDPQVLCHRLPRQIGARGQTRDGLRLATA